MVAMSTNPSDPPVSAQVQTVEDALTELILSENRFVSAWAKRYSIDEHIADLKNRRERLIAAAERRGRDAERAETGWQPLTTCPLTVTRALIHWPAFALNDDLEQSDVRQPENDLVSMGFRTGKTQWECDIVTEHFEDEAGFGYGEPTHWMPLPDPPAASRLQSPTGEKNAK